MSHSPKRRKFWFGESKADEQISWSTTESHIRSEMSGSPDAEFYLVREVRPGDDELFVKVRRLCEIITGSPSSRPIKGEIESMALEIGHFRQILDATNR